MEDMKLKISASPHVRSKATTSDIMFDVILALVPATAFGVYQFGFSAGVLVAVCIITAVLAEMIYQKAMHKKVTVGDYSAVVTGLLLALNLPPTLPWWMAMLGTIFAIIVVKQLFGGLGQNFMNPALAGRCFLVLSFGSYMTNFVLDGVTQATPLANLRNGLNVNIKDMFFGYTAGTIGETSTLALLIGAAYLLIKRVISPKIPLIYIGTLAICVAIYAATKDYDVVEYTLAHLCGGGLMLGAWFMATDYVTSPITASGKVLFGIILGLLTFVLRIFGGTPEGVSYAIIISNLLVPLIEKVTAPKSFGYGADTIKEEKKAKKAEEKATKKSEQNADAAEEDKAETKPSKFDVKGFVNAIVVLSVISVVMGAALAVVNNVTKEPIAKTKQEAKEAASKKVYPTAANIATSDKVDYEAINEVVHQLGYSSVDIDELAVALDSSGAQLGYVVTATTSEGYGGDIQIIIGVSVDGTVQGLDFLVLNETVGFGLNAKEPEFIDQFVGQQVLTFEYTKTGASGEGQVDAISGATITTSAVVDAINASVMIVNLLGGVE
ncbi:MAG: RnfABCDGE type electron transport complex subunit D [Lachnospiraceae bacterium]|nr:RnfABCDGE type electron transport complex subunit D [Lachnospiraceae bacterium]MBQ8318921.1 RnfABCDGE type electron transport complex subunit D [Lachnospiraceae bacterium]